MRGFARGPASTDLARAILAGMASVREGRLKYRWNSSSFGDLCDLETDSIGAQPERRAGLRGRD